MIKVKDFFMLEEKAVIGSEIVKEMTQKDYSYVLVYRGSKNNVIGTIKIKEFAIKYLKSEKTEMQVCDVMRHSTERVLTVYEDTNLLEMLMLFQAKSTRFALVVNAIRKVDKDVLSIMYTVLPSSFRKTT
jgi:CBS domain containing-hemolysin-like protein